MAKADQQELIPTANTVPSVVGGSDPHLIVVPSYTDPVTGQMFVHRDLVTVRDAWENEKHIPPRKVDERFGDVESWAEYVKRFGDREFVFLTWNEQGLRAVLDYHSNELPNRCQWIARYPFTESAQLGAWREFADGSARRQRDAIDQLEDLAADIVEPNPATLTAMLRTLRASTSKSATTEVREDGGSSIRFASDSEVKSVGKADVELPSTISIQIPLLAGHTETVDGIVRGVLYRLAVRLRGSADDQARLTLRLSLVNVDRALEEVYAERVAAAKALLGDGFQLLRAA